MFKHFIYLVNKTRILLLNTTHNNKENTKLINDKVGKAYSFFEAFKMKGIGSKRMIIDKVSPKFSLVLNKIDDINYGNIELRPNGILIHITKGLKNYTWVIPYYQLVLYKVNGSSIHANGNFIHFRNNKTYKENKAFFDRLQNIKTKFDQQYNFTAFE